MNYFGIRLVFSFFLSVFHSFFWFLYPVGNSERQHENYDLKCEIFQQPIQTAKFVLNQEYSSWSVETLYNSAEECQVCYTAISLKSVNKQDDF